MIGHKCKVEQIKHVKETVLIQERFCDVLN